MNRTRTFALIDLDAIEHNFDALSAHLEPGVKKCCVIKADGYGHGAVTLGRFLEPKADWFAVAAADEAIELRNAGIKLPILILGRVHPDDHDRLIKNDVDMTVFTRRDADLMSAAAGRAGRPANVHIAVDTGMGRIGLVPSENAVEDAVYIASRQGLSVNGIFTHYATADCEDKTISGEQTELFTRFVADCEAAAGKSFGIHHISNSAAISEFSDHFDMARMGISLYGLYPSDEVDKTAVDLKPAMTLVSRIVNIKTVQKGAGVSYGHIWHAPSRRVIATVCAGYADGYPRALSNTGKVLIRGQYAPITGRVCMDQFMCDVTDIPGVSMDDEVILMGGYEGITAEDIGGMSASFNYETVCGISRRVPRVYIRGGQIVNSVNYII